MQRNLEKRLEALERLKRTSQQEEPLTIVVSYYSEDPVTGEKVIPAQTHEVTRGTTSTGRPLELHWPVSTP